MVADRLEPATPDPEPAPPPSEPEALPPPPTPPDVSQLNAGRIELLQAGKVADANRLCRTWMTKKDNEAKAEAHKCLANVLVHQAEKHPAPVMISTGRQRVGVGGMAGPPRLSGKEVALAIDQLDEAASLNPTDRSVHEGRLFLCTVSGQFKRAVVSLELSLEQHGGADAEVWLQYMDSFTRSAAPQAVAFSEVIVQAYPKSTSALVTLGGWQAVAGQLESARKSLANAIASTPTDAMAHWRMGELLELEGDHDGAMAAFRKSLALKGAWAEERQEIFDELAQREAER